MTTVVATTRCADPVPADLRTVLITDIVGSTTKQAALGDCGWRDLLLAHRSAVRASLARWGGYENDTAGDGFYATFADAYDALRCALEVVAEARALSLELRAGLHRGSCELADDKCAGLTVSIGARVTALAHGSEVLATHAVRLAVADSRLTFTDRGTHLLKGVPGRWRLYRVDAVSSTPPASR